MTLQRTSLAARGLTFSVRRCGLAGGDPVMLLHGFPECSAMWEPVMTALAAAGYDCAAPDQRGYSAGARPEPVSDYRHAELVADIFALADALGWGRFHLVAHDWGAIVGWLAAIARPDRLASFTALSIPHSHAFAAASWEDDDTAGYRRFLELVMAPEGAAERVLGRDGMAGFRETWPHHRHAEIDETLALLGEPGALSAALAWYRAADGHRCLLSQPPAPVEVPSLLLMGCDDPYVRGAAVARGEAIPIRDYRRIDLAAGHWLVQEQTDEVIAAILGQLDRHGLAGPSRQPAARELQP